MLTLREYHISSNWYSAPFHFPFRIEVGRFSDYHWLHQSSDQKALDLKGAKIRILAQKHIGPAHIAFELGQMINVHGCIGSFQLNNDQALKGLIAEQKSQVGAKIGLKRICFLRYVGIVVLRGMFTDFKRLG